MKLEPDALRPTALPFDELFQPKGIAVDRDGTVYVASNRTGGSVKLRLFKLESGADTPTEMSFNPAQGGLAVNPAGDVIASYARNEVVQVPPDEDGDPVKLPFPALNSSDVAVDSAGNVYVASMRIRNRQLEVVEPAAVYKLAPDA